MLLSCTIDKDLSVKKKKEKKGTAAASFVVVLLSLLSAAMCAPGFWQLVATEWINTTCSVHICKLNDNAEIDFIPLFSLF